MEKSKKTGELDQNYFQGVIVRVGEVLPEEVDQDALQLMDECNKKWVYEWSKEVNRRRKIKQTSRSF